MAFCLLILPRPAASRYNMLPPLLPLLPVSVAIAVPVAVAVTVATVSFVSALS